MHAVKHRHVQKRGATILFRFDKPSMTVRLSSTVSGWLYLAVNTAGGVFLAWFARREFVPHGPGLPTGTVGRYRKYQCSEYSATQSACDGSSLGLNVHTCATCQSIRASTCRERLVLNIKHVKHDVSVKKKSAIDECYWPMRTTG